MITASAVIDNCSCLIDLDVSGHAGHGEKGYDIVCSAVTVLSRTAGRILISRFGENCMFESGERGSFKLKVLKIDEGKREWTEGITEFLLNGLSDLEREYPACIKLEIISNEEMIHGS